VHREVLQLAGLLAYQPPRPSATAGEHAEQRAEHDAECDPAGQQPQRVRVCEDARGSERSGHAHGPAPVKRERNVPGIRRSPTVAERGLVSASAIADRQRRCGMAAQRARQHHLRQDRLAEPADERAAAPRHARRHDPSAVHRGLHLQHALAQVRRSEVGRCAGVSCRQHHRLNPRQRTSVNPRRRPRTKQSPCHAGRRQAVKRAIAPRHDRERARAGRPDRRDRLLFERPQPRSGDDRNQLNGGELGIVLAGSLSNDPAHELRRREVRLLRDERARARSYVRFALDRQP
jgi:hypothetical protein